MAEQWKSSGVANGVIVLAFVGGTHLAIEQVGGELRAVADAEDRNAEVVETDGNRRGAVFIHGRGAAGQHDADRVHGFDLREVGGHRAGMDLAVDALLADPARDQLRVLRSEIEDQNQLMRRCLHYSTR